MIRRAPRAGPPLAKLLARRLLLIAGVVLLVNSVVVGVYYGSDRRTLQAEAVNDQVERIEAALTGATLHGGAGPVEIALGPGPAITVRDHGPGLAEGTEDRLLDPFWRGPGAAPGGAGLGLAIVDRVQRAQGGTVEARNAPGGGAEFVLRWPPAET